MSYLGTTIPAGLGDGVKPELAKQLDQLENPVNSSAVGSVPSDPFVAAERAAHVDAPHAPDVTQLKHKNHAATGKQIPGGYQNLAQEYGLKPAVSGTHPTSGLHSTTKSQLPVNPYLDYSSAVSSESTAPTGLATAQPTSKAVDPRLTTYGQAYSSALPTAGTTAGGVAGIGAHHTQKQPVQYPDTALSPVQQQQPLPHGNHHHHGHHLTHHHHHNQPQYASQPSDIAATGLPTTGHSADPYSSSTTTSIPGYSSTTVPQSYGSTDPLYAHKPTGATNAPPTGAYAGLDAGALTGAGAARGSNPTLVSSNPNTTTKPAPTASRGLASGALNRDEPSDQTVSPSKPRDTAYENLGTGAVTGAGIGRGSDATLAGSNPSATTKPAPTAARGLAGDALSHDEPRGQTVAGQSKTAAPTSTTSVPGSTETPGAYPASADEQDLTPGSILASLVAAPAGALATAYEWLHPETGEKGNGAPPQGKTVQYTTGPTAGTTRNPTDVKASSASNAVTNTTTQNSSLGDAAASVIAAPLASLSLAGGAATQAGSAAADKTGEATRSAADGTGNLIQKTSDGASQAFSGPGYSGQQGSKSSSGTPAYASVIAAPLASAATAGEGARSVGNAAEDQASRSQPAAIDTLSLPARSVAAPAAAAGVLDQGNKPEKSTITGQGSTATSSGSTHGSSNAPSANSTYGSSAVPLSGNTYGSSITPSVAYGTATKPETYVYGSAKPSTGGATGATNVIGSGIQGTHNKDVDLIPTYGQVKREAPTTGTGYGSNAGPTSGAAAPSSGSYGTAAPSSGSYGAAATSSGSYGAAAPSSSTGYGDTSASTGVHKSTGSNAALGAAAGVPAGAVATPIADKFTKNHHLGEEDYTSSIPARSRGEHHGLSESQYPQSTGTSSSVAQSRAGAGVPAVAAGSVPVGGKFVEPSKMNETSSVPLAGKSSRRANQVLAEGQHPESSGISGAKGAAYGASAGVPAAAAAAWAPEDKSSNYSSKVQGERQDRLSKDASDLSGASTGTTGGIPAIGSQSKDIEGQFVDPSKTNETSSVAQAGKSSRGANQVLAEGQHPESSSTNGAQGAAYGAAAGVPASAGAAWTPEHKHEIEGTGAGATGVGADQSVDYSASSHPGESDTTGTSTHDDASDKSHEKKHGLLYTLLHPRKAHQEAKEEAAQEEAEKKSVLSSDSHEATPKSNPSLSSAQDATRGASSTGAGSAAGGGGGAGADLAYGASGQDASYNASASGSYAGDAQDKLTTSSGNQTYPSTTGQDSLLSSNAAPASTLETAAAYESSGTPAADASGYTSGVKNDLTTEAKDATSGAESHLTTGDPNLPNHLYRMGYFDNKN